MDKHLRRAWTLARTAGAPLLISLVPERFEDGAWSGVPRFDWEIRKALPEIVSLRVSVLARTLLHYLALRRPDAVVITGSETSVLVPEELRTIVVHHGCAQTHFDRDPEWRDKGSQAICDAQRAMYARKNRWFVAPSRWTAEQFSHHYAVPQAQVIPLWVPSFTRPARPSTGRKVVLGDFRNFNKGENVISKLTPLVPDIELRALACTYETRHAAYATADAYMCLSLSEGASYAMCDAEAGSMPIVTTNVGNCEEFTEAVVIDWRERDDPRVVTAALQRALTEVRGPSFYQGYRLEDYSRAWRALIDEVYATASRPALRS